MYYTPDAGHGLPHNPFKAVISPRPIAWISTQDAQGIANLAPYSFFNGVADNPPQIIFGSTGTKPDQDGTKDTLANIRAQNVFCVNIVAAEQIAAMNISTQGFEREVDEFDRAGLSKAACQSIDCPRIADAPASLECRLDQIITLKGPANFMVIAEVTGVHLRDDCLIDGIFDVTRFQPVARLGYRDYCKVSDVFSLARPED